MREDPRPSLELEIDATGTALYVRVATAGVTETREIDPGLLADYDSGGRLVGLEVIGLGKERVGTAFRIIRARFGAEAPALQHLSLLIA